MKFNYKVFPIIIGKETEKVFPIRYLETEKMSIFAVPVVTRRGWESKPLALKN